MLRKITRTDKVLPYLLLFFAAVYFIRIVSLYAITPDTWLHVGVGKYILTTKHIPSHSDISYKQTPPLLAWRPETWVADILFALIFSVNSFYLPILLILLAAIVTFIALNAFLKKTPLSGTNRYLLSAFVLVLSAPFWKVHPMTLTFPLFAALLSVTDDAVGKNKKTLWLGPAIVLIWSNVSATTVFIPAFYYTFGLLYPILKTAHLKQRKDAILAIVATLFACFLNPIGLNMVTLLSGTMKVLQFKRAVSSLDNVISFINLTYVRESISSVPYVLIVAYLIIISLGVFVTTVRDFRKCIKLYSRYLFCMPFLILPFVWVRLIPYMLLATVVLGMIFVSNLPSHASKLVKNYAPYALVSIIAFLLFYALMPYKLLRFSAPQKNLDLIINNTLPLNLLTTPEYTGYAYYRLTPSKLNLDLQDDIYDENETISLITNINLLTKDSLRSFISYSQAKTILAGKELGSLAASINEQYRGAWALVNFDESGFLFVNRDSMSDAYLAENELKYVRLAQPLGSDPKHIKEATTELEHYINRYPENRMAKGQLATLYRIQSKSSQAEQLLLGIPPNQWDYVVLTEMGRIKASQGKCQESAQYYLQALEDRNEQNFSRATLDLGVLYAGCLHDIPRAKHYFERYKTYVLSQDEKDKLQKLAADFGVTLDE